MAVAKFARWLPLGLYSIAINSLPAWASPESNAAHSLVNQAWSTINTQYVDAGFLGRNWRAVKAKYVDKGRYPSRAEAYQAVRQMVAQLKDPYTKFLEPQEYAQWQADRDDNAITGVGIIALDPPQQPSIVIAVLAGSPAERAGLQIQDRIVAIDGKLVQHMTPGQVARAMGGAVGHQMVLTVQRRGQQLQIPIAVAKFNLPNLRFAFHREHRVGYIRLLHFGNRADGEMGRAIATLEAQQPRGYILDLRGNPGGQIDMAEAIAGQWLGETVWAIVQNRQNGCHGKLPLGPKLRQRCQISTEGIALTRRPLVVLVDGSSASASEMLAGALQDQGRAVLVGEKTFGKGVAQAVFPLADGSALNLTVDRYLTPRGRAIHGVGLKPNVPVVLSVNEQRELFRNQQHLGTKADRQYLKALSLVGGPQ